MAKKIKGPQMLIANRLDDGRVVFFTRTGGWSSNTDDAAYGEDEVLESLLERAQVFVANNTVIDLQAIGAVIDGDKAFPSHIKHAMQAKGPSVRADLGYQTSLDWEQA
ncbi:MULTISPECIES: DUF2849 domain-containing protein [Kordiimonas]|uniref:DUF2849 domain-containing protein n=1 Tax=Kordiimonas TaxID=288021 RepID=UPI001FF43802|nr:MULTISPECIES: DUF2849 domain-containing protein [Kordiimonas]MCK0069065.1 DUF2849 domain-containing protein [Kordiimonas laminariae]UTW58404.1 DUF2849 domain-containing protein [Kordiimonas sp. SCSIO 12603]